MNQIVPIQKALQTCTALGFLLVSSVVGAQMATPAVVPSIPVKPSETIPITIGADGIMRGPSAHISTIKRKENESADEKALALVAAERHVALMAKNTDEAYKFLSQGSKKTYSRDAYSDVVRGANWTGASVERIDCDAEGVCVVNANVKTKVRLKTVGGYEHTAQVRENWLKTADGWRFVVPQ